PGAVFAIISGVYYWYPKWTGHYCSNLLGTLHFWLSFISVNLTFFPMHFIGLAGMPRRVPDYSLQFVSLNQVASVGAFIFGMSQVFFFYILIAAKWRGMKAEHEKCWEGAEGLEWTVPTPAPLHTFCDEE
ncbi:MAG: cytochrome c oxidase subunit I, partial [Gammaproteobacteria bacterium]|nr:cytochrome c oxidase subunit I [Gammaproteobacteria bacterium]